MALWYTFSISSETAAIEDASLPEKFNLHQNYPNPFNASTVIQYDLPYEARVSLKIFNIVGDLVITLEDNFKQAGMYIMNWDGRDKRGTYVTSGTYMYQLNVQPLSSSHSPIQLTKKMVFEK